MTVESLALEHFVALGWKGIYSENAFWRELVEVLLSELDLRDSGGVSDWAWDSVNFRDFFHPSSCSVSFHLSENVKRYAETLMNDHAILPRIIERVDAQSDGAMGAEAFSRYSIAPGRAWGVWPVCPRSS